MFTVGMFDNEIGVSTARGQGQPHLALTAKQAEFPQLAPGRCDERSCIQEISSHDKGRSDHARSYVVGWTEVLDSSASLHAATLGQRFWHYSET